MIFNELKVDPVTMEMIKEFMAIVSDMHHLKHKGDVLLEMIIKRLSLKEEHIEHFVSKMKETIANSANAEKN